MKIGIDISQLAFPKSGVANYLESLLIKLIENDSENEYVLFFASLRGKLPDSILKLQSKKVFIKKVKIPPTVLDILWNRLHVLPVEWLTGKLDFIITSDWTEPPTIKAKKATILYDLIVYKYPQETDKRIVSTQKRKLKWVKKESDIIFCISKSTLHDAQEILGVKNEKLKVLYPGI